MISALCSRFMEAAGPQVVQNETTETPALDDAKISNQRVNEFLEYYENYKIQQQFRLLADHAKRECEDILETTGIKGMVQSRSKKHASLQKKLKDMAKEMIFVERISGDATVEEGLEDLQEYHEGDIYDHPEMGDLAGIRVGLYFPADVRRVAEEINRLYDVVHTFGTVQDTRTVVTERNTDIEAHGNGRWISQNPGEDVHHWEHYGYKSWQVVVQWRRPYPEALTAIEAALAPTDIFHSLKVEIQVGTIVTQAWAEVQHNIIYKNPYKIDKTPTMLRMIDAINGLAINTDIMLNELEKSLEQAKLEAAARRQIELAQACLEDNVQRVKELIEDGANVNHADEEGDTPLHRACKGGSDEVLELLLAEGAKANVQNSAGWTPLHEACDTENDWVMARLLSHGVDIEIKENMGNTPLHLAAFRGFDGKVQQLLSYGARTNSKTLRGMTPYDLALRKGKYDVLAILEEYQ